MKIPHSTRESEALLRSLLPARDEITVRPMFGNLAAFVNGNMSVGLYGDNLMVRLPEADRADLLKNRGAAVLEPMKGRQMKEYVTLPKAWLPDRAKIKPWVDKSLEWSGKLPPKKPKKR